MQMVIIAVTETIDLHSRSRDVAIDASQIESIEQHDSDYTNHRCNICMRSGKKYESYNAYRIVIRQLHEGCPDQWFGHLTKGT